MVRVLKSIVRASADTGLLPYRVARRGVWSCRKDHRHPCESSERPGTVQEYKADRRQDCGARFNSCATTIQDYLCEFLLGQRGDSRSYGHPPTMVTRGPVSVAKLSGSFTQWVRS